MSGRGDNTGDDEWDEESIERDALYKRYIEHSKEVGVSRRATQTALGQALRKLGVSNKGKVYDKPSRKQKRTYKFPSLEACRDAFEKLYAPEGVDWTEVG